MEVIKKQDYSFDCRYSEELKSVLFELEGVKELRVDYEDDYEGFCYVEILLKDGRVFSYGYEFDYRDGRDDWEIRYLPEDEIKKEMKEDATYFDNIDQYNKWRERVKKGE